MTDNQLLAITPSPLTTYKLFPSYSTIGSIFPNTLNGSLEYVRVETL